MENGSNKHNYTLDTCVGIKICENANVGDLLSCRLDFESSTVHISSQTVLEAIRLGYDVDLISKQIKELIGARVIFGSITSSMIQDAKYLETKYSTLHDGDSEILAYARATNTILITCDKGLAQAATLCGTNIVNPDLLPCDEIGLGKSKMQKIVDKAIRKPSVIKQNATSFILKPGQKIIWRSFQ